MHGMREGAEISGQFSAESFASLGKRFSCRVANMQDDHVSTGDFVKNEIISNRHHPVLEVVSGIREALWEIFQRKAGKIQF